MAKNHPDETQDRALIRSMMGREPQKVDPSVQLGSLGEYTMGAVPLERTMQKPQAYRAGRNYAKDR